MFTMQVFCSQLINKSDLLACIFIDRHIKLALHND